MAYYFKFPGKLRYLNDLSRVYGAFHVFLSTNTMFEPMGFERRAITPNKKPASLHARVLFTAAALKAQRGGLLLWNDNNFHCALDFSVQANLHIELTNAAQWAFAHHHFALF